jgi:hypothetical protein
MMTTTSTTTTSAPPPPAPPRNHHHRRPLMSYRSAILSALEDLKDHQTGSTASSILRRIAEARESQSPGGGVAASTGASASVAAHHVATSRRGRATGRRGGGLVSNVDDYDRDDADDDTSDDDRVDGAIPDDDAPSPPFCMSSFMTSLKSLVRDGTLIRIGGCGSNYGLSDATLWERARTIESRVEERMGRPTTAGGIMEGNDGRRHLRRSLRSYAIATPTMTTTMIATPPAAPDVDVALRREIREGGNVDDVEVDDVVGGRGRHRHPRRDHPREEPPKAPPKRRTAHVKNKIDEAGTVSAVVMTSSRRTASDATTTTPTTTTTTTTTRRRRRGIASRRLRRGGGDRGDGRDDDDGMETDDDTNNLRGVVVRIVPRRVSPRRM